MLVSFSNSTNSNMLCILTTCPKAFIGSMSCHFCTKSMRQVLLLVEEL